MRFFVYGTLLKGEPNHRVIEPYVESIEPGVIHGTLYDYGPYPFLVLGDTGHVYGEWITVKENLEQRALVALDRLECYREGDLSNLYERVTVRDAKVPDMSGYVYVCPENSTYVDVRKYPIVAQGNWRRRREPVYFAYGSCMNVSDFLRTCPDGVLFVTGILEGYEMRFNGYSLGRHGGVANIAEREGSSVEGVLWSISEQDIEALDHREGHPVVYHRRPVVIRVENGFVKAFTYQLVRGDWVEYAPSAEYLALILNSPVSQKYKEKLQDDWFAVV